MRSTKFVVGICLVLPAAAMAQEPPRTEFQDWFAEAALGKLVIPPQVEQAARQFRYVFVAGFRNERMTGYFAQNAKELRARGVDRRAIHFIYPSSHETVASNVEDVRAQFLEIADKGPERLVVIAHSRGACDALAFALRNPEFVRDHVEALFLVQGPFGGTGLADYVAGEGPALARPIPLFYRIIAHLLGKVEKRLLKNGKHEGLLGMTRRASHDYWERTLRESAAAIPIVGPKTFYVTSETHRSRLLLLKRAMAWYLQTHFGANDGLVAVEDQSLPAVGNVLAVLDAGHSDLTNRYPSARPRRQLRRALIQTIVMAVGRSAVVPERSSASRDRGRRDFALLRKRAK